MNVSLTKELEQFVHDRVRTGRYHSASEVVREGLRLLESREQLRELQVDEMRRRLVIGTEVSVPGVEDDGGPRLRAVRPGNSGQDNVLHRSHDRWHAPQSDGLADIRSDAWSFFVDPFAIRKRAARMEQTRPTASSR